MTDLYLRKCSLIVSTGSEGIELSEFRIRFQVIAADVDAPNTAIVKVYNLAQTTAKRIEKEYQNVVLQAGYRDGNFGIIFRGTIKQIRRGRESATDTFVEMYCADGDLAFNFATINKTMAAGSSLQDRANAIVEAAKAADPTVTAVNISALGTGGVLPRGKVLFGMARDEMRDVADTGGVSWSIQDGQIVVIPYTGYLPGEALVLTSRTGLIGIPEATNNGVSARILLNPAVKVGTRVKIDNTSINTTTVRQQGFPRYTDINFPASVTEDGVYRVLVAEHAGDTWGDEWYTDLTCLSVDPSTTPGASVQAYG